MSKSIKRTLLGDLLVQRGAITPSQLKQAIHEQRRLRRLYEDSVGIDPEKLALGNILCDLGFIDKKLLKTTLKRQRKIRKAAVSLALITPLLSPLPALAVKDTTSNKNVTQQVVAGTGWKNVDAGTDPGDTTSDDTDPGDVGSGGTAPSISVSWLIPDSRESGEALELYDIAGYEILYKAEAESLFTSEIINDPQITEYQIKGLQPGNYEIKIASIDVDGLYSRYETIPVVVK